MRGYKFRGFGIVEKKWFFGDLVQGIAGRMIASAYYDEEEGADMIKYDPIRTDTVGQYTERKDARGSEIYDGDILQEDYPDWKYIVYWDETMLQWSYRKIGQEQSYAFAMSPTALRHFTVVGNKWDNPELMQEGGAE